MADHDPEARRTVIGGRHGSPSVTIAWPFSNIVNADVELRDAVADLALLVARLAGAGADGNELTLVRIAAEELSTRLAKPK
jgi:hypothetical protein